MNLHDALWRRFRWVGHVLLSTLVALGCAPSGPAADSVSARRSIGECVRYGFATMAAWEHFTRECSRDPAHGGRTAEVAIWFNCRLPSQSVETQELRWTRCLTDVIHPSGGVAVETWSLGCTLVNGACVSRDLGGVNLGDLDPASPEGILLRGAYARILEVRALVNAQGGTDLASRLLLLDAAEMISDSALDAFRERAEDEGSSLVSKSLALIDLATNFVPGVSTVKDVTIVLTGVNPITGEEVSDAERAMVAGTLLVPSFVSGATHGLIGAVRRLDHVAASGIRSAEHAAEIANAVRRADDELRVLVQCATSAAEGIHVAAAVNCGAAGAVVAEVAQRASENLEWLKKGNTGFGIAPRTDYAKTFRQYYANVSSDVAQVHHAVEQQVLDLYPGIVTEAEIHSLENLRGIPRGADGTNLHQSLLRQEWNSFYRAVDESGRAPTKQELLDFAKKVDDKYGSRFVPPVR